MRFAVLVDTSRAVATTSGRLEKIERLAELLKRTPPDLIPTVISFLSGSPRQGRIGVGGSLVRAMRDVPSAAIATLDLQDVDASFERLAAASGPGSAGARAEILRELMARATAEEQDFLIRLLLGELRQGALEGVLTDAVARASIRNSRARWASPGAWRSTSILPHQSCVWAAKNLAPARSVDAEARAKYASASSYRPSTVARPPRWWLMGPWELMPA